jgi:hypothetical protein
MAIITADAASRLLLSLSAVTAAVAVPMTQRCVGGACPTWPAAVHMEASMTNVACNTLQAGQPPTCVRGVGNATWDTLGNASRPGKSLSHSTRTYSSSTPIPGQPPLVLDVASVFWQDCTAHASWQELQMGPANASCIKFAKPCIHRYDPISLALFACSGWTETPVAPRGRRYFSSNCNFAIVPMPGVQSSGSFDVWYKDGDEIPYKFTTNTTTVERVNGQTVRMEVSETTVAKFTSNSPNPAVFRGHCTPDDQ